MENEKLFTVKEVAERYKVDGRTVTLWIRTGKLKATRNGAKGHYRIKQEHLDEFEKNGEQG